MIVRAAGNVNAKKHSMPVHRHYYDKRQPGHLRKPIVWLINLMGPAKERDLLKDFFASLGPFG